jgi:hypothetical protein
MSKISALLLAGLILLGLALLTACSNSPATTTTAPAAPGQDSSPPPVSTPTPLQTTTITLTTTATVPVNTPPLRLLHRFRMSSIYPILPICWMSPNTPSLNAISMVDALPEINKLLGK